MCQVSGVRPRVGRTTADRPLLAAAVALLAACSIAAGPVQAAAPHTRQPATWHDVKCSRYRTAWSQALARTGSTGLGQEFLASHQAFLASNCTIAADVCPHSAEEFRLANLMVVLAMNAGTASTFPPFACRH